MNLACLLPKRAIDQEKSEKEEPLRGGKSKCGVRTEMRESRQRAFETSEGKDGEDRDPSDEWGRENSR